MAYQKQGSITVTFPNGEEKVFTSVAVSPGIDPATKADIVDGKVPADELPSYVDDIVEYPSLADFPATGETGKIYVALDTNLTYRWAGSEYVQVNAQDNVAVFSSVSAFPAQGADKVIYIATDTNLQYRWTGSAYALLSDELVVELPIATAGTLTDEQYAILSGNNAIILYDSKYHYKSERSSTTTIIYQRLQQITNTSNGLTASVRIISIDASSHYYSITTSSETVNKVEANTMLDGTESSLTSLQVGSTKYKVYDGMEIAELSSGGTLTDEQFAKVSGDNCIIKYDDHYFRKEIETTTCITYQAIPTVTTSEVSEPFFEIIKSSKVYTYYSNTHNKPNIVANPTLAGTESSLTGLQVGSTKYKVSDDYMTAAEAQAIWENAQFGPVSDTMSSYTWSEIKAIAEAGRAPNTWLGQTKTDVGTDSATRTFRVCDMQGLYGKHLVFEQVEEEISNYQWNPSTNTDSDGRYANYSISDMRTTHLPAILLKYSSDLQAVITNTTYKVATNDTNGTILELTDKLFLPAEKEIFGSITYSRSEEANALTQFQYYVGKSASYRIKYQSGTVRVWWERSPRSGNTNEVCFVNANGLAYNNNASLSLGVAPCFAL